MTFTSIAWTCSILKIVLKYHSFLECGNQEGDIKILTFLQSLRQRNFNSFFCLSSIQFLEHNKSAFVACVFWVIRKSNVIIIDSNCSFFFSILKSILETNMFSHGGYEKLKIHMHFRFKKKTARFLIPTGKYSSYSSLKKLPFATESPNWAENN